MAAKNRRMFELRLGKLGLVLFVGVMSVLLCSMFFLGILVGKQMEAYPERFSTGVAAFLQASLSSSPAGKTTPAAEIPKRDPAAFGEETVPAEGHGGKKEEALTGSPAPSTDHPEASFPPTAAAGKPPTAEPRAGTAGAPPGAATPAPPAAAKDGLKPGFLPEKKPAETLSGILPAAPPAPAGGGQANQAEGLFEIQVAAYQDQRKAEQMIGKLKPLGFASRTLRKEIPGKGVWYRVVVGGFETREKAKTAADAIAGKLRGVKCVIRPASKNGGA